MKQQRKLLKSVGVVELERNFGKCLAWFYAYPKAKIGLTALAKSIRSSKTATKQIVESLIKIKLLNREIVGKAWLLSADQKHPDFIAKKIIPSPRAIILFGSYRWGSDLEESDIDVAVEVLDNHDLQTISLGVIPQIGYRKNIQVNLYIFSRNKIDLNLFANIANGIVLDGFLEISP